MRIFVLMLALGLAACSGLPPESTVALATGDVAIGLTADLPVSSRRIGSSVWAGVGVGSGVDAMFAIDAPFVLIGDLIGGRAKEIPFAPPGIALRKSFDNGVAVGLGVGSDRSPFENPGHLYRVMAGPFASVGSSSDSSLSARATLYVMYEAHSTRRGERVEKRQGIAAYGIGTGGLLLHADSSLTVLGARSTVGGWLVEPHDVGVTVGPAVQRIDTTGRATGPSN